MKQETLKEAIKKHLYVNAFVADPDNPGFVDRFIEHTKAAEWGAQWQRNHVWHRNTELPENGRNPNGIGELCLTVKGEKIFVGTTARTPAGKYYFSDDYGDWHPIESITAWAYLKDLRPTSFDEILEANKDVLQRLKEEHNEE